MTPCILVVEDSRDTQLLLGKALGGIGASLKFAGTAAEAFEFLRRERASLILLDIGLPDQDGLRLMGELRAEESTRDVPVMFLTGTDEIATKVTAFAMGAEDYIVKPFEPLELRARVESRLRKLAGRADREGHIRRGGIHLDSATQRVSISEAAGERTIALTSREFKLLFHLARHEDTVFSRGQLLDAVWGVGVDVYDRTVDTHISSIRKKLGPHSSLIDSISGAGYRFRAGPFAPS